MSKDEIFDKLKNILVSEFELDEGDVTPDALLGDDLDLDSIDSIDLIVKMKEFMPADKGNVDPSIFKTVKTVQDVVEVKTKGSKNSQKKVFPGYVIIHMDADDNHAWFIVRNTKGVTGFVGPGSKPVPLEPDEVARLQEEVKEEIQQVDFEVGDMIRVVNGTWKETKGEPTIGEVTKIDVNKRTVTIMVEFFGQNTPVEISFADVKKMD